MAEPVDRFVVTPHALFEMRRRGIREDELGEVLAAPGQRWTVRAGRDVLQSRVATAGKPYLLRVFVDTDCRPPEVVTAYRTGKIEKYWRP
ncbi:MAG: DUF4258 domain-containing protein [Candidatus Coatesbacteria bacterium]